MTTADSPPLAYRDDGRPLERRSRSRHLRPVMMVTAVGATFALAIAVTLLAVVVPAGEIRGRIVTMDGTPIAGLLVYSSERREIVATTANDGRFVLQGQARVAASVVVVGRGTATSIEVRPPERGDVDVGDIVFPPTP